jgi:hypothetical protein
MLDTNTCFSNNIYNRTFQEMAAKVKGPELINNVTFPPITTQVRTPVVGFLCLRSVSYVSNVVSVSRYYIVDFPSVSSYVSLV